jgi:hypothetical protein
LPFGMLYRIKGNFNNPVLLNLHSKITSSEYS